MAVALATNVPRTRTLNTTTPLQGGGNLGADRTISLVTEAVDLIYATMPAFSVKRAGGDPTGVADSSAAVQSCVDAASAQGGGVVVFGPGVWKFANCYYKSGVMFKGAGSCHSPQGVSATIWRLNNTSAGSCLFRLSPSCGEYIDGGCINGIELDGTLYSGVADVPAAPTTTVEVDKVRGIDLRQGPLATISAVDTTTKTITTSAAHGVTVGMPIGFALGSGGVIPTGLTASPTYYYAGQITATTLVAYDTAANAIAGGATGRVNVSGTGSGTRYVFRTIVGIYNFAVENCYLHNFDECMRGSSIVDRCSGLYTKFAYSYVGFQGQEHPRFLQSRFQHCVFGLTGRFVDMILNGSNQFTSCNYGVAPYDPVGAGTNSYLGNSNSIYTINSCTLSGEYFRNVVAITINSSNIVASDTYVVGDVTDSGTLAYSKSIGVRIQGTDNSVSGKYGEGTAATSFGVAAILLDRNGNGGDGANNIIAGATFNLVSAISGNAAIAGGDTNLATPLFGTSNYGALSRFSIRNCKAKLGNLRFFYGSPGNGSMQYAELVDNSITNNSGGSNTMGSSAGVIEGSFYTGCDLMHNRVYNVNGTAGSAIKQAANLVMTNTRVIGNRFDGTFSVAPIDNTTGTPSGCTYRSNGGITSPYVTENSGTGTFSSGATTLVISHGLAQTPLIQNIQLTPQSNTSANGVYWISTVTSTQFTINVATGSGTPAFSWQARLSAA